MKPYGMRASKVDDEAAFKKLWALEAYMEGPWHTIRVGNLHGISSSIKYSQSVRRSSLTTNEQFEDVHIRVYHILTRELRYDGLLSQFQNLSKPTAAQGPREFLLARSGLDALRDEERI